jgi:carboxyl-terminal processing protease
VRDGYSGVVTQKIITRGEIELSSVPYAGLVGSQKNIAFVKLTQFTVGCGRLVRNALDSLKKVDSNLKGVVLDLRNNPGGLLDEAVNVCNIFIDKGQLVVRTKGKVTEWDYKYETPAAAWDSKIPVTVLVNHSSASASEIVAGTLQDLDRGVIIGERSYGKGLVQKVFDLGYKAKVKLTTAKYYIPSDRCIQAIDYTHRNPDGSVGYIPDSLKKAFKTKSGRKVMSGGGVEPDIAVKNESLSRLAVTIYTKNYFFDYATEYVHLHPTIASAGAFTLSNSEFNAFAKWLENKDYSYKTETEDYLDSLKQYAAKEKYFDDAKNEFTALQKKISHDKKQDLLKHQEEVTRMLESEIIFRYYFLRGRIEQGLLHDDDLVKALNVIEQPTQYQAILKGGK